MLNLGSNYFTTGCNKIFFKAERLAAAFCRYSSLMFVMAGSHQAVVGQSSDSYQTVVRQSSGSHQAVVRQSSGSRQAVVRQSQGSHKVFIAQTMSLNENLFSAAY